MSKPRRTRCRKCGYDHHTQVCQAGDVSRLCNVDSCLSLAVETSMSYCRPCIQAYHRERDARRQRMRSLPDPISDAEAELIVQHEKLSATKRPKDRGECKDACRPCPWYACRHHLGNVVGRQGSLSLSRVDIDYMKETCALDVADKGGNTLEGIGSILGITRERVRQIEAMALTQLRDAAKKSEVFE